MDNLIILLYIAFNCPIQARDQESMNHKDPCRKATRKEQDATKKQDKKEREKLIKRNDYTHIRNVTCY